MSHFHIALKLNDIVHKRKLIRSYLNMAEERARAQEPIELPEGIPDEFKALITEQIREVQAGGARAVSIRVVPNPEASTDVPDPKLKH